MYDRRIKDRTLTLAVSGKLWNASLVMIDRETNSLWSHLLGRAMRGELIDAELTPIPSVMTDWKSWRATHPGTTVVKMDRSASRYRRGMMQRGPTPLVIGLVRGKQSRAWRFHDLRNVGTVNEVVFAGEDGTNGLPIVVVYDDDRGTAVAYNRKLDDRLLTFTLTKDGRLKDRETNSEWDLLTGNATAGPLKGKALTAVNGVVSAELAWRVFYPKSTYWKPNKTANAP